MNLEGITINILTSRLQEKLLGGKIYKVFMPNKSSLLLLVKTENAVIPLAADFPVLRLTYICRIKRRNALKPRLLSVCFCASIWKKDALPK